jgi:uncharacterized linocin/CFP29 family protein
MNFGRDAVPWGPELWGRLDQAVHAEVDRAGVAGKVLPLRGPLPDATTVPADVIDPETMSVQDDAVLPLVELSVEFSLTEQQVEGEAALQTAVTLATRAANLIAQAEDLVVFQGGGATDAALFKTVRQKGVTGNGLVAAAPSTVDVAADNGHTGERIVDGLTRAYAELQTTGQYGPYALVLRAEQYADAFKPLANTLVMPADRLRPLVQQGFFGTGTMPEATGLVMSVGGGTMDLMVGIDPTVAFLQIDGAGLYRFRVFERFALRLKDEQALVRLQFVR